MKTVCVYLGANLGNNKAFEQVTIKLAQEIVDMGHTLIYGSSSLGMMGLLATTVKSLGDKAEGVMPGGLGTLETCIIIQIVGN